MVTTPDTVGYLVLGLAVVAIAFALYIGSLWTRYRSLQQDEKMLLELGDE